ncbi:MAG: exodeoxyribonuclease VII large subunit [Synergistales bacterium]|nr:exodeoxyribonuclease VII large subunit [Synergistales bacterium]
MQQSIPIRTVSEVNTHTQELLGGDVLLRHLAVRGEILQLKRHSSGHVYYSLGDGEARISCVFFRSDAARQPLWPQVGDEVLAEGRVSVYPARGIYQLYTKKLHPVGAGARARAREELRRRLEREGLFAQALKRPLPAFPGKIAAVTSPTGAAVRDVLHVSRRRFPQCAVTVVPCVVQGVDAPGSICAALERASLLPDVEAVLLVRGGGSKDDLAPFDDEDVVRAVRRSPVPLVTGIGHEIDESLADLAADRSAPTPSAAAETVLPDRGELLAALLKERNRMERAQRGRLAQLNEQLGRRREALVRALRYGHMEPALREVQSLHDRGAAAIGRRLEQTKSKLERLAARLNGASPLRILERGFISCEDRDGARIRSVRELHEGKRVALHFLDGVADAVVDAVTEAPEE